MVYLVATLSITLPAALRSPIMMVLLVPSLTPALCIVL